MPEFLIAPLHRILLCFDPETSHHWVVRLLRLWQWFCYRVLRRRWVAAPAIHVPAVPELRFATRVGLAAGFDKNAAVFAGLARLGFGFLEVGTVTPLPQEGNPRPRIWRAPPLDLINHLGFNNCGLEEFRQNLQRYRGVLQNVPIWANIGKNKATPNEQALDDYRRGFEALADQADAFVVNLSSPNTPGLTLLQSEPFLEGLAALLPKNRPTFLKFSPDLEDKEIDELCEYVARSRFRGVVLTNTSRKLAESLRQAPVGGLSGASLSERSLACVARARQKLPSSKLLVGSGGVVSVEAAQRLRTAGADLVEVYTGFVYKGPRLVREIGSALGR